MRVITVPGRNIYPELQALMPRRCCDLFHHVAFTAAKRAVPDTVFGSLRWPETETVVMLTSQYHGLKTAGLQARNNRLGIKGGRIENRRIFVAQSPFAIR